MGGHAIFGNPVHFLGTDLNFNPMTTRSDDGRVKGPVAIRFWCAYKIFNSARNDVVGAMDDTKRSVALFLVRDNNAERDDVRYLFKRDIFFLRFAPY